jgi:hypothetical protein
LVNAKNRYGAYAGYVPFVSVPQTGGADFAEDTSGKYPMLSLLYCLGCMMPESLSKKYSDLIIKSIRGD